MDCDYRWLTPLGKVFLERDYLLPGQTLDERVDIICNRAEEILKKNGFARKFKEYLKRGWYSLSTPIWSNFGTERGLPISCFGTHVSDTCESIAYAASEIFMMTKCGGGTSASYGDLRPRGASIKDNGTSSGAVNFMLLPETIINIVSQGRTRRGNCAIYLPIDHGDIEEFLTIRSEGSPLQDIFPGVCISDDWMKSMIDGDQRKRSLWARVLESRMNTGLPYLFFTDNVNNNTVDCYKDQGYKIKASNLCTEIMLPSQETESFVCDLASMVLLYYDEWKGTDAVEVLTYVLDAVMTDFIDKAKNIRFMERSVRFAERHRALGIGQLGWHSYLQSKMIPYESMDAKSLNIEIAKLIKKKAYKASATLAQEYGEPEVLKGYGRRNSTLIAIAPTKSSAFIMGQLSEFTEPHRANYYIKDLAKGKFTIKNQELVKLLQEKGQDTEETWNSILKKGGSVQHLDFLSSHEKAVFKTFAEISQKEVVIQAVQRQKYIDQGQSLNLMIHPSVPIKDVNALYLFGWEMGIKSFYYQYGVNAAQEFSRNILSCTSCES